MKFGLLFSVSIFFFFSSCAKGNDLKQPTSSPSVSTIDFSNISTTELYDLSNIKNYKYDSIQDPIFWNLDIQKGFYIRLFDSKDIEKVLGFRLFIESLAKYHHDDPVFEYNPVFLAMESYIDMLPSLYEKRPDLFKKGNLEMGSESFFPIIHALRNGSLKSVRFFFEKNIDYGKKSDIYGHANRGGSEYLLDSSIMTDARDNDIKIFLEENGFNRIQDVDYSNVTIDVDQLNLFANPGFNESISERINKNTHFSITKITLENIDSYQWLLFSSEGKDLGWAPLNYNLNVDTGI